MGAGRKTKTLPLKEKSVASWTVNCSAPARNLRKSELGAVIFGCKHHTFKECLQKQLFGLPAAHISYVKNITPGVTLFLFNYSDRKLHGIFEATSHGQMNIDPCAWIGGEDAERTPYAAQVRVLVLKKCRSLREEEFKPIIANNYYDERLFWFELDKGQASRLTKLFSSSSLPEKIIHEGHAAAKLNNRFNALPISDADEATDELDLEPEEFSAHSDQLNMQRDSWHATGSAMTDMNLKENHGISYASVLVNRNASVTHKWSELSQCLSSSHEKNSNVLEPRKLELNITMSDRSNTEWELSSSTQDTYKPLSEACPDEPNTECGLSVPENCEDHAFMDNDIKQMYGNGDTSVENFERGTNRPDLINVASLWDRNFLDAGCNKSKPIEFQSIVVKAPGQAVIDNDSTLTYVIPEAPIGNYEIGHNQPTLTDGAFPEGRNTSGGMLRGIQYTKSQSVVSKLMEEIEGLKVSQLKQGLKINYLEQELVNSKLEIYNLKERCNTLESGPSCIRNYWVNEGCEFLNSRVDESVLIVGGFDGSSWLPALSSYSPSQDHVKSLCSLTSVRSYASAAKLNGELYIFGGVHDDLWYDTVESYNPISGKWTQRPSLNQKKGSLAGASLYGKIFAIGGGNGVECLSDVEVFDLNIGRWISTRPLLEKRFAPAAADLNGTLYVAGGYDGMDYLRSVERYDPRECSWIGFGAMNTKRGCHSLVALNEKLYALGGYDGTAMVSTIEVFDPRVGLWMMEKPMNKTRGHFGSFVFGGKIYVVGGIDKSGEVLDVIECFEEGSGWQVTDLKALGKRCFFSALVF